MPESNITISIEIPPRMRDMLSARFRRDTAGAHDSQAFNKYLCRLLQYALRTEPVRINEMQDKRRTSPYDQHRNR